jgi:hypothetical protein
MLRAARTASSVKPHRGMYKGPTGGFGPGPSFTPPTAWFLPGANRMLAGEARHIASDRAGFLGSHPEATAPEPA